MWWFDYDVTGCNELLISDVMASSSPFIEWFSFGFRGFLLWNSVMNSAVCPTFILGSHVLSLCGYPSHLTRYSIAHPRFWESRMASTSYSASSLTSIGPGRRDVFFWCSLIGWMYSFSNRSLKTSCFFLQEGWSGSWSRYAAVPTFSFTINGPCRKTSNLADVLVVRMFFASSHTRSPGW